MAALAWLAWITTLGVSACRLRRWRYGPVRLGRTGLSPAVSVRRSVIAAVARQVGPGEGWLRLKQLLGLARGTAIPGPPWRMMVPWMTPLAAPLLLRRIGLLSLRSIEYAGVN